MFMGLEDLKESNLGWTTGWTATFYVSLRCKSNDVLVAFSGIVKMVKLVNNSC